MKIIILPKIKVQNANAISSAFSIGFPAMTAWAGAVHALERKLKRSGFNSLAFKSFSVICHEFDLQTYKGIGDYVYSVVGMGFPLNKDGERSPFIEEARCHLTVSIIIEYEGVEDITTTGLLSSIKSAMNGEMKIAGGDILGFLNPLEMVIQNQANINMLIRTIMPGYYLVERRDIVIEEMSSGKDALAVVLDAMKVTNRSYMDNQDVTWIQERAHSGWIVPIAVGFQGLTPLGRAKNQRDDSMPHRFAEAVVTLGEFKMVHHIRDINEILWRTFNDSDNDLYVCVQKNQLN